MLDSLIKYLLQKGQRFHSNNRVNRFKQQNGKLAKKGGGRALYGAYNAINPLLKENI